MHPRAHWLLAALLLGCGPDRTRLDASRDDAARPDAMDGGSGDADAPDATAPDAIEDVPLDVASDVPERDVPVVPQPPRQVFPASTSRVTSQRPTLRWELAPGTDGARVELCRDRACAMPIETLDVRGTEVRPTVALPPGPVFWRLRGLAGATVSSDRSWTWTFHVGRHDAPVDTAWGSTLDVNGDGHADGVVMSDERFAVFHGGPSGLSLTPDFVGGATEGALFVGGFAEQAQPVLDVGDVNGDGFGDVMAVEASAGGCRLRLYLGSDRGLQDSPILIADSEGAIEPWIRGGPPTRFTQLVAAADVNADGYSDLVILVERQEAGYWQEEVLILPGGAEGPGHTALSILSLEPTWWTSTHAVAIRAVGDVNGDGYPDLLIAGGATAGPSRDYQESLYLGGPHGPSSTPDVVFPAPLLGFGTRAAAGGVDTNGDGYSDLLFARVDPASVEGGPPTNARVEIHRGGAGLPRIVPDQTIFSPAPPDADFGETIVPVGDVDGDGYEDALVTAQLGGPEEAPHPPRAFLFLGGASGLSPVPTSTIDLPLFANLHAYAGKGDVDGDGHADLLIGVPGWLNASLRIQPAEVWFHAGSDGGFSSEPTRRIPSLWPMPSLDRFGKSVALLGPEVRVVPRRVCLERPTVPADCQRRGIGNAAGRPGVRDPSVTDGRRRSWT